MRSNNALENGRLTPSEFIDAVQARAARVTVGASALRGQGAGIAVPARAFLATLPLAEFSVSRADLFQLRLAKATSALRCRFPAGTGSWGLSRKLLNIFLREALYTRYLADRYRLLKTEFLLELPLDSITAKKLRALPNGGLPPWPGVKHLRWPVSSQFQAAALAHAQEKGIARVHLDAVWWGHREIPDAV